MKLYKGFEYPELKEIFADEEKYIDPEHPDQYVYKMGPVTVYFSKDMGQDQLDKFFKNYVDKELPNIMTIAQGVGEFSDSIANDPMKEIKPDPIDTSHISLDDFDSIRFDVEGEDEEEVEKKISEIKETIESGAAMEDLRQMVKDENGEEATKLTEDQVDQISEKLDQIKESSEELKKVAELPSNNGKVERSPEEVTETGEMKQMVANVNPQTGESAVIGEAQLKNDESFEHMLERLDREGANFEYEAPVEEQDVNEYLNNEHTDSMLTSMIGDDVQLEPSDVRKLIEIANRRINKEKFNVFKEYPEKVQHVIDNYIRDVSGNMPMHSNKINSFRNKAAESILDDFIMNINYNKVKKDFSKEVEEIFAKSAEGISEDIVGYSENKINAYRAQLDKMQDPEKKERLRRVLEAIDSAYDLETLKEFAKKQKIKKFDLEKPDKYFNRYHNKYKDSPYDTFSLTMSAPILMRHLNTTEEPEAYSYNDVYAFLICFCKFVTNYDPKNMIQHSYMYYVMYNIVLTDVNIAENTRATSDKFIQNVKDVIENLRQRNKGVL